MDLSRNGNDQRKKGPDDKSEISGCANVCTLCNLCGLPILSDKNFAESKRRFLKTCQCILSTTAAVSCPNQPQQPSVQHQPNIIHPNIIPFPNRYYVPRVSVAPFGKLPVVPLACPPSLILHPGATPLRSSVTSYQNSFIKITAETQTVPEISERCRQKVKDWLLKQDFLSHATEQENFQLFRNTGQTSDNKQPSKLRIPQEEEQRVRNSTSTTEENSKDYITEKRGYDTENNIPESKKCDPRCTKIVEKKSTNPEQSFQDETNLSLRKGKSSRSKSNTSSTTEEIKDFRKAEVLGKEINIHSKEQTFRRRNGSRCFNRTNNRVSHEQSSSNVTSNDSHNLNSYASVDANHHSIKANGNDCLENDKVSNEKSKNDFHKRKNPRPQRIIRGSSEVSHENQKKFNKENSGSSRRKKFQPKKAKNVTSKDSKEDQNFRGDE